MPLSKPTDSKSLIRSAEKMEAMEVEARDLARRVESLRQQALAETQESIAALDQKARDLAEFVTSLRQETQIQATAEITALGQKARDLAASVERVRAKTLLQFDTEIAALRHKDRVVHKLNEELEQRIRERTEQLEAANRELEAFAFSVSHDLRSPLRAIDGFSQELLDSYSQKLDPQGQHYLRRIRAGTQRMGQLIDDLLKLSRLTRIEMHLERVNLTALAETVASGLRELEPERNVTFTAQPGLTADGDPNLIRVVLENLFGNAWKFTSKNAAAVISFSQVGVDGRPAFVVRDDGAGFDMAYVGKLFGAFQRLHSDREFPGTGIGLATIQRVVRRHGGEVWAEGAVGRGAAFFFTLPGAENHS